MAGAGAGAGAGARGGQRCAVAIHNFKQKNTYHLELDVGDLVEVERECSLWYYGKKVRKPKQRGIFPKSYVVLQSCSVEKSGNSTVVNVQQTPIVQEITHTLRDWNHLWKRLYVDNDEKFKFIEVSMRALLELRREILSGTLPQDKLKKVERTAIYTMDRGNRQLGMDLTVRSSDGKLVDPFEVSTSQLNNLHDETNERVDRKSDPAQAGGTATVQGSTTSYTFFASVRNFVCKMTEDAELLMSLYDGLTHRQFTENYVVRWSKGGLASDIDQMHNLKVVFTDLGLSDIKREKVYLVCLVVRRGGMEAQSIEHRRSSVSASVSAAGRMLSMVSDGRERQMRRPFGVAAMDVTRMLNGQQPTGDEQQYCVPFQACERENLDSLLKKIISNKDLKCDAKTGQGLWISLKLLKGDMKQIREDSPHVVVGNVAIARKMGFPEVIMPGDARNDLYMTLVGGSFTKGGGKSTDRNIEVTVRVADKFGRTIPGVISLGGGYPTLNEYTSVVYYHEDKPRWQEVFKICIPIEEFKQAHVVFLFKHRSSNEAKDKAERHFALSYTQLMQPNGTTLNDTLHHLCVYKVDTKRWPNNEMEAAAVYMSLPSQRSALPIGSDKETKISKSFLSLVNKDVFTIDTNVCSTKLTQNVELLGALNWVDHIQDGTLRKSLKSLQSVPGEEVVKFLQDILDALFNILTKVGDEQGIETSECQEGSYNVLAFECLLYVITLVTDLKYHHFQPVLDVYIQESFCDTLAHIKLLQLLSYHILTSESSDEAMKTLLRSMKCLEYLIRFIVRSRELHAELTPGVGDKLFHQQFQKLLQSMVWMMQRSNDKALTSQGTCIKYLPCTVSHIIRVYPDTNLSTMIGTMLDVLPITRLTKQRLMTVLDLVQGPLFLQSHCRQILIPHITSTLRNLIQNHDEYTEALSRTPMHRRETNRYGVEMRSKNRSVDKVARVLGASRRKLEEHRGYSELLELCIKTLSELLTLLFRKDVGPTVEEFRMVAADLLRTVINTTLQMQRDIRRTLTYDEEERDDPILRQMVSVLLDMLRQMTMEQYESFVEHLGLRSEILGFLTETQTVLRELVQRSVYRSHWSDMINMQNFIILNSLRLFSTTLVELLYQPFERQVWLNWFYLTIDFITQPALQLDKMRPNQKKRLLSKYNDMRREAAFLISNMWFNLGDHKRTFIPGLVGPFLETSLTPDTEVRKATIPLFFDMMLVESSTKQHSETGLFKEFENEMIDKLDTLVESGKGDTEWRALFVSIVGARCLDHNTLREAGSCFVAIIGRLVDTLLLYRDSQYSSTSHHMQVTTHILDFYSEIERPHMYIRYVNKLCELHSTCEHWAEAGLSLRLHAMLLAWSDAPIAARLRHPTAHTQVTTHRQLKEALYLDIIEYLHKGKMWEIAIEICKELVTQYEDEVFDYDHLSSLYYEMSRLYKCIMMEIRPQPEYFRVAYYGLGFPEFLRNKKGFVYRGREYERLQEFTSRLLNDWPNAEVLTKLEAPGEEIINSPNQYVQINAVTPIMSERKKRLSGKPVSDQILNYYKYNNVDKFIYSRPLYRQEESDNPSEDQTNEFASLWLERTELEISDKLPGILRWFPIVKSSTFEMSPLEVAIEKMQEANKVLKSLVLEHKANNNIPLDPLTRKLNGMVDAAVMGGIVNYERAFFTPQYRNRHPEYEDKIRQLKDLIADQIPLLEFGVEVHRQRAPASLAPLHKRISECFEKMRAHVYENYGQRSCDLSAELPPVMMRRHMVFGDDTPPSDSRLSELSTHTITGSESNRNTATSLKQAIQFQFSNKQLNRNSLDSGGSTGTASGVLGTLLTQTTPRKRKERRSRKSELGNLGTTSVGGSMWYTGTQTPPGGVGRATSTLASPPTELSSPLFELRQPLTPSRPLRSEVERERRLSQRPNSMQSGTNSNRNSIGTTDSNQDEEENPPPLPQKHSKTEHKVDANDNVDFAQAINNNVHDTLTRTTSLTNTTLDNRTPVLTRQDYDIVIPPRGSFLYSSLQQSKKAPTPPPKKKNRILSNL